MIDEFGHRNWWSAENSFETVIRTGETCMNNEVAELKNPYFDIQAKIGITIHLGGLKATKELVTLCHIDASKCVLVVGCGNGISVCKILKMSGCTIVGIDISERMVDLSRKRAENEVLSERVEFNVADVQDLPFSENMFDVVISESVTSFHDDKQKAISEYVRVLKKGGYLGLNEITWMQEPTSEMRKYAINAIGGCKPETAKKWNKLLNDQGLQNVVVKSYYVKKLDQFICAFKMTGLATSLKGGYLLLLFYLKKTVYRDAIINMAKYARSIPKYFRKYHGYGIYVGRKQW